MKEHYGWRARIGLIYLAPATVMEPEFYAMAPEGVSIHSTRIPLSEATVSGLSRTTEGDRLEQAASLLSEAPLHCILFGGTSATFLKGLGWDIEIIKRLETVSKNIPATTTSTASVEALRAVGAKRISFVGPYVDDVTQRGRKFFASNGFEITGAHGMGISDNWEINALPLERIYQFTKSVVEADADTVFISCTGMRSVGAIASLEADLNVPVVSAVQASFWKALRLSRVNDKVSGFGRLFDRL
jgi:maleate isomerase